MNRLNITLLVSLILYFVPVHSAEKPKALKKQTVAENYLTAKEAHNLKQQYGSKLLFVDVRTPSELVFVGSTKDMDVNIPLLTLNYKKWDESSASFSKVPNEGFVASLNNAIGSNNLTKNSPIILLCRSGKRSAMAANLLTSAGYSKVYTIVEGFEGDKSKKGEEKGKRIVNGWKNAGLPWNYKLKRNQLDL